MSYSCKKGMRFNHKACAYQQSSVCRKVSEFWVAVLRQMANKTLFLCQKRFTVSNLGLSRSWVYWRLAECGTWTVQFHHHFLKGGDKRFITRSWPVARSFTTEVGPPFVTSQWRVWMGQLVCQRFTAFLTWFGPFSHSLCRLSPALLSLSYRSR